MDTCKSVSEQAIAIWEELTGQRVHSTQYSFCVNGTSFDLYGANKRVHEALKIADDVTITLIIKTLTQHFAKFETFTLADILSGNSALQARIELLQRLSALFSNPETTQSHEAFYKYCEGAIAHYRGLQVSELTDEAKSFVRGSGCFVGLDAYHGVNKLTRLMVCDGPTGDSDGAKVSQFVFAFRNIEELITHARNMPTGFSLCSILAEHISDSYFAMVVRNGGRIIILTDKGNYTHPLQEELMRNRNDRYNLNRIENSHFPYDLLDIKWGDNGRRAGAGASKELALSNDGLRVIGGLSDLNDWDLLWLHLFIDQCRDRYFDKQLTEPQLALGTMIRLPHKWLPAEPQLPVPIEYELRLEARSSSELTTKFMESIEPEWSSQYNANRWMEDRFAAQVPDEALYIPPAALDSRTPKLEFDAKGNAGLARADLSGLPFWEEREIPTVHLRPLNTALSTPERVLRDAHFLARHNQATVIKRLAILDYKQREAEMQLWFYKAAAKNLPNIISDLLLLNHERFQIDTPQHQAVLRRLGNGENCFGKNSSVTVISSYRSVQIDYTPVRKQILPRKGDGPSMSSVLKLENHAYAQYQCAVDKSQDAQLFIGLTVSSILDLMNITGLDIADIPPELHHLGVSTPLGNSILDRIDPLSVLKNPWDSLRVYFRIPVSLTAFKQHRRNHGLSTPKAADLSEYAKATAQELSDRKYATAKKQPDPFE